jgi:hypothetical protein
MISIADQITQHYGFIQKADLDKVIYEDRLYPCLIRCGGGRLSCPAQDVEHWIEIIEKEGSDYIRDVSLQPKYSKR